MVSIAAATFRTNASEAAASPSLLMYTAAPQPTTGDLLSEMDWQAWASALGGRKGIEEAVAGALASGDPYPADKAGEYLHLLGWRVGAELLAQTRPEALKLTLGGDAYSVLPEIVPVDREGGATWLDTLFPIYRTLHHIGSRPVQRRRDVSIALVSQSGAAEDFDALAQRLCARLVGGSARVIVDTYPGSRFATSPEARVTRLAEIFYRHRAVAFLGHLDRDGGDGGWQLAPGNALPMREIRSLLGSAGVPQLHRRSSGVSSGVCIPEVVFTACCSGAWKDAPAHGAPGLFYPELFLDAGVRFFVGAWTDVALRAGEQEKAEDLDRVTQLMTEFFARWAEAPDGAIRHLHEAKRSCGFHLVTSLYQMYTVVEPLVAAPAALAALAPPVDSAPSAASADPGAPADPAASAAPAASMDIGAPATFAAAASPVANRSEDGRADSAAIGEGPAPAGAAWQRTSGLLPIALSWEGGGQDVRSPASATPQSGPSGAIVSALRPGVRVGPYVLGAEVWADSYARTFFAQGAAKSGASGGAQSSYLVQVLADEWPDSPELQRDLKAAVTRLRDAGLGPGHLVPDRYEPLELGDSRPPLNLHVLVYDRPAGETASDWTTLARAVHPGPGRASPAHYMTVLQRGAEISAALQELHGHQLLHGNLYPGNVALIRRAGTAEGTDSQKALLKDAWVRQVSPGRCTDPRYAAPEEPAQEPGTGRLKYDCWGLGIILFEEAVGRPPRPAPALDPAVEEPPASNASFGDSSIRSAVGDGEHLVPEALERVVRECLTPSADVRPDAALIAKRLDLAVRAGGPYVGDLEAALDQLVSAGQRLIAIEADDLDELAAVLDGLATSSPSGSSYRIYDASPDGGVVDRKTKHRVVPAERAGGTLEWIANAAQESSPAPVPYRLILVRGTTWLTGSLPWEGTPASGAAAIRILRLIQGEQRPVVVVLADKVVRLEPALARSVVYMRFPDLPPSELFERILGASEGGSLASAVGRPVPPVTTGAALTLAQRLYPCSRRQLRDTLRVAGLRYGVVDERAASGWELERAHELARLGGVTYTPVERLELPQWVGLAPHLAARFAVWAEGARDGGRALVPRRLLISGPSGYGKSLFTRALARAVDRPLLTIDAYRCLSAGAGESERTLRAALSTVETLSGAVVAIEAVDRLAATGAGADEVVAALGRMASIILRWLDEMPAHTAAVLTCAAPAGLPAAWRRRVQLTFALDEPVRLDGPVRPDEPGVDAVAYRRAVFTAIFRRLGLGTLAEDGALMAELASGTHPDLSPPLVCPAGKRLPGSPLAQQTVQLRNGAEIKNWIDETILLNAADEETDVRSGPQTAAFWREMIA